MNFLKTVFCRPFTAADLEKESEELLSNPPLPPNLLDAFASLRGKKGRSLLEWWRREYIHQLEEIVVASTWKRQRSCLIRIMLRHKSWESIYSAAKDLKFLGSWEHCVKDSSLFVEFEKETWPDILFQVYMTSILSSACLWELGMRLYSLDEKKELEIDLYYGFSEDIWAKDFGMMELMLERLDNFEDEDEFSIAELKDNEVNPFCDKEFALLSIMEDEISNDRFDADKVANQMELLDLEWAKISAKIMNSSAYEKGQEFVKHTANKIEQYMDGEPLHVVLNLLEVFRGRMETVYDEPDHDPKAVAAAEFKIFGEQIDRFQKNTGQELTEYLSDEFALFDQIDADKTIISSMVELIEKAIEPQIEVLYQGAKVMFEAKLEEIDKKADDTPIE